MKRFAKRFVAAALALLCLIGASGVGVTVFATEVKNEKAEAEALWNAFLEATAPVETDEQYKALLDLGSGRANSYATCADFEEGTGRDREEFINMTPYERFKWYFTFVRPYGMVMAGDYQTYCSSLENWNHYTVGSCYDLFETYGNEEMLSAYRALMEWDYNYFKKHGAVYCFMKGKNANELKSDGGGSLVEIPPVSEEVGEEVLEGGLPDEEIEARKDGLGNEGESIEEQKKSESAWNNVATLVKENVFSIFLLLALAGAGVIVAIRRRNAEYEE